MRLVAIALVLVAAAGCGAKTGVREPPRCDTVSDCPAPLDFCSSAPLCLANRCALGGPPSCDDARVCTVDGCDEAAGACTHRLRDQDGDGHADASCGGDDCNDQDPSVHPGAAEVCTNHVDDDCNGRTDCSDPACAAAPACAGCMPERCINGRDDDCDGLVDCADSDCIGDPACCTMRETDCANGRDDDCDGLVDCLDPDCSLASNCCTATPELCNGLDDDCDGVVDDGVPCWFIDPMGATGGTRVTPITIGSCGADWYSYGVPDFTSANPRPDVRERSVVTVVPFEPPTSCGGRGIAVIADTVHNGTGGRLEASFSITPAMGVLSVSDDPNECHLDSRTGTGACGWRWESCCTDGMLVDHLVGDFCFVMTLSGAENVSSMRVLDHVVGEIAEPLNAPLTICQRTVPAHP